MNSTTETERSSFEAISRGFQVISIVPQDKRPIGSGWPQKRWPEGTTLEDVRAQLAEDGKGFEGQSLNIGVLLGEPSRNLVDVDLDHPATRRLKDHFLPPTPAVSERAGKSRSHYWYFAEEGTLPGTRKFLMQKTPGENGKPDQPGSVIVELRATGAQTVIPPSIHPTGEAYTWWNNRKWGGKPGPAVVNGRVLQARVAMLALASLLLDNWPTSGARHDAYLALAGGLLHYGDSVHPFWGEQANAAEQLIRALAEATMDEDGPDSRVTESVYPTMKAIKAGKPVVGFPRLAQLLGDKVIDQARVLMADVEQSAGFTSRQSTGVVTPQIDTSVIASNSEAATQAAERLEKLRQEKQAELEALPEDQKDPLDRRVNSWDRVDLEPYLQGQVSPPKAAVLQRSDGKYLMYPGRVNMLYGSSESAKSWIALFVAKQVMESGGQRAVYLDFEDEPANTLSRLMLMGARKDDLRFNFTYFRPEEPLGPMEMDRWGNKHPTVLGESNEETFTTIIRQVDPTLIVVDGMTVLYGLHGLNTNDSASTDIITGWLKKLTRNGRTTVIVIDHTNKGAERGHEPTGSQHKKAMVQGTMLQVWAVDQPMPGKRGQVELITVKDRPGDVRANSVQSVGRSQLSAMVTIDSTQVDPQTGDVIQTIISVDPPQTPIQVASSGLVNAQNQSAKSQAAAQKIAAQQLQDDMDDKAVQASFGGKTGVWFKMSEIVQRVQADFPDLPNDRIVTSVKRLSDQTRNVWPLDRDGVTKGTRYALRMEVD